MAKEPKDRDEAKRPELPGGDPNAAKRKDAPGAKGDGKASFLPDDSFLQDVGEVAPRVKAGGQDDANEEWILVDDDLMSATSATSDGDASPGLRPTGKSPAHDAQRDAEAARLVSEMKDMAAEAVPMRGMPASESPPPSEADVAPQIAEIEAQAIAPMDPEPAVEAAPAFEEPLATDAADAAPAEESAPVLELAEAKKKKSAPRSTSRSFARAAGLLVAAGLAAGGWYAYQKYWPKDEPTEVASQPTVPPAPHVNPNAAKPPAPVAKPPDVNGGKPAPTTTKPTTAPAVPNPAPAPDPATAIPVIQPDPTATAPSPAGDPKVQPPSAKDPTAPPAKAPTSTTIIVDPRQPIRPAKVTPAAPGAAKSTTPVKKTDTIVELKNGYTMRGRLKRVKDDQITLGVTNGEFTFPLADVKILDASAPDYMAAADMPPISIVLKGGQRLRGKKMKEDAEKVVLVVDQGQIVVMRSEIREVSPTGRIHF
jgi:hypothetical protein